MGCYREQTVSTIRKPVLNCIKISLHLNAQTLATYFYNALNKAASIKPLWNMFALAKVSMWNQKVCGYYDQETVWGPTVDAEVGPSAGFNVRDVLM